MISNSACVRIASTGMWAPSRVLTNLDLEKIVDTSDEWIATRTGIRERRIADEQTGAVDMGYEAAFRALEQAGANAEDVDVLLVSTATPDRLLPSTACDIQARLGARRAVGFDVIGACTGWLYALNVARGLVLSGQARNALVVATEKMSAITDWSDRSTCVLFGDAAGAAWLVPSEDAGRGILSSYMRSDGALGDLLYISGNVGKGSRAGGEPSIPIDVAAIDEHGHFVRMAGPEVFKAAVRSMSEASAVALQRADLTADQVDLLIPHQANIRIIEATAKYAGIPMDRVWVNIDRYGNTSSASIPVSIHEAWQSGRVGEGSVLLLVAFGAGFTWASTVLRL